MINKKIKEIEDEIDEAQEDYANLDWISKKQALKIIEKWGKELSLEIEKKIDEWKEDIEALRENNHLEGVKELMEKSMIDDETKVEKVIFESEIFILDKLKQKLLGGEDENKLE